MVFALLLLSLALFAGKFVDAEQLLTLPAPLPLGGGFGLTTVLSPEIAQNSNDEFDERFEVQDEYILSLSDEELDAYKTAPDGPQSEEAEPAASSEPVGCMAEASSAVLKEQPESYYSNLEALGELQDALRLKIETDPRVAKDAKRGARCLLEQGIGYRSAAEVSVYLDEKAGVLEEAIFDSQAFDEELNEVTDESYDTGDDDFTIILEDVEVTDEDGTDIAPSMSSEQLAQLTRETHEEELTLAAAFVSCDLSIPSIRFSLVYQQVRHELETKFINEKRSDLERLSASADD